MRNDRKRRLKKEGRWSNDYEGKKLIITLDQNGEVAASLDDKPVTVHRMFWFAWFSFHPKTALINED